MLRLFSFSAEWIAEKPSYIESRTEDNLIQSWLLMAVQLAEGRNFKSLGALARFLASEGLNSSRSLLTLSRVELWDDFLHEGVQLDARFNLTFMQDLQLQAELGNKMRVLEARIFSEAPYPLPEELPFVVAEDFADAFTKFEVAILDDNRQRLRLSDPLSAQVICSDEQA